MSLLALPLALGFLATLVQPGLPIEDRLAEGESREYRIAAPPAGTRLQVAVQEEGTDLILELADGEAAPLGRTESPESRYSLDALLAPAGPPEYRLVVRTPAAVRKAASFRLDVEVLDPSDPTGRDRIAIETRATQAAAFQSLGTAEGKQQALDLLLEALPLWRALDRRRETVHTLLRAAGLFRETGQPGRVLPLLDEALGLASELGEPGLEATILNQTGFARWSLGEPEAARALYERALEGFEKAGDEHGRGIALGNLGLVAQSRGDLGAALELYHQALQLVRAAGDRANEGIDLNNLGGVHQLLGEPFEALDHYTRALEIQRELGDGRLAAWALGNLGTIHRQLGDLQEALESFRQAREILRQVGDRNGEARQLNSLGSLYRTLGEPETARRLLDESLALRRQAGDRRGEAVTLHNLGLLAWDAGDLAGAVKLFEESLALKRTTGDRQGEAISLHTLAAVRAALGEGEQALLLFDRSAEILTAVHDPARLCESLRRRGELRMDRGEMDAARADLTRAADLCRTTLDRQRESEALLSLARLERATGRPEEALRLARESIDRIESLRAAVASPEMRATFLSRRQDAHALAIDLLQELGRVREAFAVAERARARGLLDLLRESGPEIRRGADPGLLETETRLEGRLAAKTQRWAELLSKPEDDPVRREAGRELQLLLTELEALNGEIRARSPRHAALTRPRPLDAAGVQVLLDPETRLLAWWLGEERSFLWVLGPDSFASFTLPPRRTIEEAARRLYERWTTFSPRDRQEDEAAARELSALLLGPVADRLDAPRLAIVADGALQALPFAALPRPDAAGGRPEPLLVRHEVLSLPSASVLEVLRATRERRPAPAGQVAVLADPVFRADDPRLGPLRLAAAASPDPGDARSSLDRLVWSRTEAETIAALADPLHSLVALDFTASLDTIAAGRLRDYRIVHFATHGILDSERPALSGLMLSRVDAEGRARPGFLSLHDIYELELNAELVVLSGCRTGLGREVRGEGLVGLARGFFHAGAGRVVASLWQVRDRATAELMKRFYRALLQEGRSPAAALREAQLSMLAERDWRDPYQWAGFTLYGDWR